MFKEERKNSNFKWSDIGDISKGRENLGDVISVTMYRMMQFTLRDATVMHVGVETANKIFYDAGFVSGQNFYKEIMCESKEEFSKFMSELQRMLKEKGVGILRMEEANMDDLTFVLTVSEDLDCSGLPPVGETVCKFDEGFLAGILESYTGKKFNVKEVDCWGTGARVCRFTANKAG